MFWNKNKYGISFEDLCDRVHIFATTLEDLKFKYEQLKKEKEENDFYKEELKKILEEKYINSDNILELFGGKHAILKYETVQAYKLDILNKYLSKKYDRDIRVRTEGYTVPSVHGFLEESDKEGVIKVYIDGEWFMTKEEVCISEIIDKIEECINKEQVKSVVWVNQNDVEVNG